MSKGEKLAQRLSQILAQLHKGDALDKHQLAQDFQVDVHTIERDLGERLRGIVERSSDGQWHLTHSARSTAHINHIHQLLPVVQYWLPHVLIVQPVEWHEELVTGLRGALSQWES